MEYTPQSYLPADLDLFFKNFSSSQIGQRPVFNGIDGGKLFLCINWLYISHELRGVLQTIEEDFGLNGESNLDLQYSMALVGKSQPVTLYQVGDLVEGGHSTQVSLRTHSGLMMV